MNLRVPGTALLLLSSVAGMSHVRAQRTNFSETKTVEIRDPFFHITAFTVTVPANWKVEGTVLRGGGCGTEDPQFVLRAESADGLTGVQAMPKVFSFDAADPRVLQQTGHTFCAHLGQVNGIAVLTTVAGARPGATIVSADPASQDDIFQRNLRAAHDAVVRYADSVPGGFPAAEMSGVESHLQVAYPLNGHPEEEVFIAQAVLNQQIVPMLNGTSATRGRMNKTDIGLFSLRAPKGVLATEQDQLFAIIRSRRPTQEWQQTQQAYFQRGLAQAMRQANTMIQRNADWMHRQQQIFEQQSRATLDNTKRTMTDTQRQNEQNIRTGEDQRDFLAGNQYFRNEETGERMTLSASDGQTYQRDDGNGQSTILRTNDAYLEQQLPSDWYKLEPISH
jgi:hypothetical protein